MDQIVKIYQTIPTEVWVALIGGSAVSLFSQVIKKLFGLNSDKVIKFLVGSSAFAAAALQYLLSTHAVPPAVLGAHFAAFYSGAEFFYTFIYKTATPFFKDVSKYQDRKAAAAASNVEVAAVQAPSSATPTPVATIQEADF